MKVCATCINRVMYSDPHFHAAFPSICALNESELLLVFRRARDPRWLLDPALPASERAMFGLSHFDPRSHLMSIRLDALTLAALHLDPIAIAPDAECAEQDASLYVMSDGTALLGSFGWYPVPAATTALTLPGMVTGSDNDTRAVTQLQTFVPWGVSIRTSTDAGRTFGAPYYFPPMPGSSTGSDSDPLATRRGAYRGALRGSFCECDGEIFVATYDAFTKPGSVQIYSSIDAGVSFGWRSTIADPAKFAAFQEPALLTTPAGTIVLFIRTTNLDDAVVTARSKDGRTWEPPVKHSFKGHPCHPLVLKDGRVLLTYGYRHAPFGIRARIVDAELTNIDDAEEIMIRDDGESADIGYPWAVQLPNGDVLIVYYWVTPEGVRSIMGTHLSLD